MNDDQQEKLLGLLKRFRFKFGNQKHIDMMHQYEELLALRKRLADREEKAAILGKELRSIENAQEKIASKERSLIYAIEKELAAEAQAQ